MNATFSILECRNECKKAHQGWSDHQEANENPITVPRKASAGSEEEGEELRIWEEERDKRSKDAIEGGVEEEGKSSEALAAQVSQF